MKRTCNIFATDSKYILRLRKLRHRHMQKTKTWERKNVNNRAWKRWTLAFFHKSGSSCEIMHTPEMLLKLCIERNNGLSFLSALSVAGVRSMCGSYLWKRASVDGRQVQLQRNAGHASPLVAAELITDGALTARLIRDSRLWIAAIIELLASRLPFRRTGWLTLGD